MEWPNDVFAEHLRANASFVRLVLTLLRLSHGTNQSNVEFACARASRSLAAPGPRTLAYELCVGLQRTRTSIRMEP